MTKPLPRRDVEARLGREAGDVEVAPDHRDAVGQIRDPAARRVAGALLGKSKENQENFQKLEEWFPIQPEDMALRGDFVEELGGVCEPLSEEEPGEWLDAETFDADVFDNDGNGGTILRVEVWAEHTAGTEGPEGKEGKEGPAGKDGEDGAPGEPGAPGEKGEKGDTGAKGEKGDKGETGAAGEKGEKGVKGDTGAAGEKGEKGDTGAKGEKGDKGETGAKGETGEKGVKGDTGEKGEKGTAGEKGEKGEKGAEGAAGAAGRDVGLKYTYLTNTEETDPGAGKLKLNKATVSEATSLRISETDGDGNAIAAYLATFDDGTGTVKGTLSLRKVGTPTTFAIFSVTGALVDKGTWDTLVITHVASSGLANNDVVMLNFDPAGNAGEKGEKGEKGEAGSAATSPLIEVRVFGNPGVTSGGSAIVSPTVLEGTANGLIGTAGVIDGQTIAAGDLIFASTGTLKSNGVYVVNSIGAAGSKWKITRPAAFDTGEEIIGMLIFVREGTASGQRLYMNTNATAITIGTTALTFEAWQYKNWGISNSLPAAARVGDRIAFGPIETEGILIYWDLMYDGTGEFPWKFMGGSPLQRQVLTDETTSSTTYANMATVGPQIKVPLKGDYLISHSCRVFNNGANYAYMSIAAKSTAAEAGAQGAEDTNSSGDLGAGSTANGVGGAAMPFLKAALAANDVVCAKYRVATAGSPFFSKRRLTVQPMRVG